MRAFNIFCRTWSSVVIHPENSPFFDKQIAKMDFSSELSKLNHSKSYQLQLRLVRKETSGESELKVATFGKVFLNAHVVLMSSLVVFGDLPSSNNATWNTSRASLVIRTLPLNSGFQQSAQLVMVLGLISSVLT